VAEGPESKGISVLEGRMWTIVMGVAMALGGVWLQNQYQTVLRVQEQMTEFARFVDAEYVDRKYLERVQTDTERRLNSIEGKIDHLLEMATKSPPLPLHNQK
jgi:hypothetical protein